MQVFSARNRNCFSLSHGTVLHSSCGSAGDSLARAACRGRLPCSHEAQCSDQARDGAVATCREEEARREAELGRAVHTGLVRLGGRARGTPRDLAVGEAARVVAPRHVAIRWKECTDRWRRGCRSSGASEVKACIPPTITRSAALGGGLRTAAPLAGMGQQDDRGPPGGMAAACLPTLALDADTATMAGQEQEGRPRTARHAIIPILREKCDRVGEAGVPVSRV